MATRGRKSAADLSIVPVVSLARPEPPLALTGEESALWRSIAESLPADWFRPSDLPLLEAYCRTASQCAAVALRLESEELVLTTALGRPMRNPLLSIQDVSQKRMATLAGKLRLCPSARYDAKKASSSTKASASGKPWQFGAS